MGFILSKFRSKQPERRDQLEKIEKEMREIQRFQIDTELTQKRMIGRLFISSSILYLIAAAGVYFFGPRGSWKQQLIFIVPFVLFPLLIWLLKRGLSWYYKRKIANNSDKYKQLKLDKQRLLEDVMEFETFNNAKQILEKFDPNRLLPKYLAEQQKVQSPTSGLTPFPRTSLGGTSTFQEGIRRRTLHSTTPTRPNPAQTPLMRPILGTNQGQFLRQSMNSMPMSRPAIMPAGGATPVASGSQQYPAFRPAYMLPIAPSNPVVHNRNDGWMDKLVDYVVGDGPNNRYALICRYCATHNGLATPEDFPYTGYRCVFCHQFNPPRQVRPAAEKLPVNTVLFEEMEQSLTQSISTCATPQKSDGETTDDESKSPPLPIITQAVSTTDLTESEPQEGGITESESDTGNDHVERAVSDEPAEVASPSSVINSGADGVNGSLDNEGSYSPIDSNGAPESEYSTADRLSVAESDPLVPLLEGEVSITPNDLVSSGRLEQES